MDTSRIFNRPYNLTTHRIAVAADLVALLEMQNSRFPHAHSGTTE